MIKPMFMENGIIPFNETFHPEFDGYLGEKDTGVFISFIKSKEKGKGNFSSLLEELKQKYDWIKIPTPSNLLIDICLNKGFKLKQEFFPEPFNENGVILFWKKEKEVKS